MRGRLRAWVGLCALSGLLTVSSAARADARADARAHFRKGMDLVALKRFEEAVLELKAAYDLMPHPNLLFNLARAYGEAGKLDEARANYRRYLETGPADREEVLVVIADLEARSRKAAPAPTLDPAPVIPVPTPQTPVAPGSVAAVAPPAEKIEDVFAETVTTATRGVQSPVDAPSSTSVISEQDIRLSGITKLPELLRRLAGVDMMQVTGGQSEVAIRGFNSRLSNRVLVLVDGRSVYADSLGATFWQFLSIGVEDIARIEVVRGPGSSMYGANAFSGVINILTKKPGSGPNVVSGGYGSQGLTHGSVLVNGTKNDFGYRASVGYDALPRWSRAAADNRPDLVLGTSERDTAARTLRVDLKATQRFGKDIEVGLGGGLTTGMIEVLGTGRLSDIILDNARVHHVMATFDSKYIEARVFWNRFVTDNRLSSAPLGEPLLEGHSDLNVIDGEVQYKGSFEIAKDIKDELRVGAFYRYKDVSWSYLDRHRVENHYGLFVHNDLRIGSRIGIVADYRIDRNPYLDEYVHSPRGTVLLYPSKQQSLRASIATAFRAPTFLESYLSLAVPVSGGALLSQGQRDDQPGFKLQKERNISLELGYRNQETELFVPDAQVFYSRVANLIELAPIRGVTVGDASRGLGRQNPNTGYFPLAFGGFANQCQAYTVVGTELGAKSSPTEGVDVYGNYTLMFVDQDESGCTAAQRATISRDQRTSAHKFNAGIQLRTRVGVDASLDFHVVSNQVWSEQTSNSATQRIETARLPLAGYTLLNARVGYRFPDQHSEISLVTYNAVGLAHRQHPFGQLVDRSVFGSYAYRF